MMVEINRTTGNEAVKRLLLTSALIKAKHCFTMQHISLFLAFYSASFFCQPVLYVSCCGQASAALVVSMHDLCSGAEVLFLDTFSS